MRSDRTASLRALCEAYYQAEDTLAYLQTEIQGLEKQLAALDAFCASDATFPSEGVSTYGAVFGHGSPPPSGTGVDNAARRHLQNVEDVRREAREVEHRLRTARYDEGRALSVVAPMRVVLKRLDPLDARIIALRFGHLGGTKRSYYTLERISTEVGLTVEPVRERISRLHAYVPQQVKSLRSRMSLALYVTDDGQVHRRDDE